MSEDARKLTEYIVSESDLRHLDAEGGAWYALDMLSVLTGAEEIGWQLFAPGNSAETSEAP